jgi:hypothetical protein
MQGNELTLVLYPNYFGMGYVIFENSPKEIVNYGMAKIRPFTKDNYIKRLHKFVKRYRPAIVILRGYENYDNRISKRVVNVIQSFEREAEELKLPFYSYSRKQIKEVFTQFGSKTKYGISKIICGWYPELESKRPNFRKNTQSEDYWMGLFDVFSLMLSHHYLQ